MGVVSFYIRFDYGGGLRRTGEDKENRQDAKDENPDAFVLSHGEHLLRM